MDTEYISLQGYIRNTLSDTEVHAEHQLRVDKSTSPAEKNIDPCKTQDKGTRGKKKKTGILVGLDLPSAGG